jgi:hypothetical protein
LNPQAKVSLNLPRHFNKLNIYKMIDPYDGFDVQRRPLHKVYNNLKMFKVKNLNNFMCPPSSYANIWHIQGIGSGILEMANFS